MHFPGFYWIGRLVIIQFWHAWSPLGLSDNYLICVKHVWYNLLVSLLLGCVVGSWSYQFLLGLCLLAKLINQLWDPGVLSIAAWWDAVRWTKRERACTFLPTCLLLRTAEPTTSSPDCLLLDQPHGTLIKIQLPVILVTVLTVCWSHKLKLTNTPNSQWELKPTIY